MRYFSLCVPGLLIIYSLLPKSPVVGRIDDLIVRKCSNALFIVDVHFATLQIKRNRLKQARLAGGRPVGYLQVTGRGVELGSIVKQLRSR